MSKRDLKTKCFAWLFIVTLMISMIPMNVFAVEKEARTSCEEGMHDFTVEKYDESNHWHECSICGISDEALSHSYDTNGDTTCNGCSYKRSLIEELSIDKTLMYEGETATITVKVIEGCAALWMYFYKPITGNTRCVDLSLDSENTYTGTFTVDDQTESGIWEVKYIAFRSDAEGYKTLRNSKNYTGTYSEKEDFSSLDFEVTGTDADVDVPVIESYSIDKTVVSAGDHVTVSVQVRDEHLESSFSFWYEKPNNESEIISMKKIDNTGLYRGTCLVTEDSPLGIWRPYFISISDTNDNSTTVYNSKVFSYSSSKKDMSSLNFEVVARDADSEKDDTEAYMEYEKEAHIGQALHLKVYSPTNQTYTITCSEDVVFTSELVGSSKIFTDRSYYLKEYEIEVKEPGSYVFFFYVKGSNTSNALTCKVKITDHDFDSEWVIAKKATTSQNGKFGHSCKICNEVGSTKSIPKITTVKLSTTAYTYDGKKKTPSLVIKDGKGNSLVKNQDYTLGSWKCDTGASASSRKSIGKYSIKVTFKGKYSGSKTLSFTIGPKNPKTVKVVLDRYNTSTVSWSKVSGVSGYKIYWKVTPDDPYQYCGTTKSTSWPFEMNDGVKNTFKVVAYQKVNGVNCNNAGKTASVYSLKKVTGVKAEKSGSKVKILWNNIPGETGYQISKSTNKNQTNIVAICETTSGNAKTITAEKGKTYYYKVRAYKVSDGKKIYAPWSNVVKFVRK